MNEIRFTRDDKRNHVLIRRHPVTEQVVEKVTVGDTADLRKWTKHLWELADAVDIINARLEKERD